MLCIYKSRALHLQSYLSLLIVGSLSLLSFSVNADHRVFKSNQGVVIYGFDPVAYFTLGKATEGSKDISVEFLEGTWRFVSEENRELFLDDPGRYIPQYGGHCAWGVFTDGHIETDPEAWRIVDGKLYLFRNGPAWSRWSVGLPKVQISNRKWEKTKTELLQQ